MAAKPKPKLKRTINDDPVSNSIPAGMSLVDEMDSIVGGGKPSGENAEYLPIPSGLNVLDYYNGRWFRTRDPVPEPVLYTGMPRAKFVGAVGYTGAGKTTLIVQAGMVQVTPYDLGTCFHFDLENAWSDARTVDITGLPPDVVKRKYRRIPPKPIEDIYEIIKGAIFAKRTRMRNPEDEIWVTDVVSGARIPAPTVFIIDTVAALQTRAVMDENISLGSLLAESGEQAKYNNAFAQRLSGLIGEVNITVYWVNHIRDKIQTGPTPTAKRIQHMGAAESIPGGHGFPQYTDYMIKLVGAELMKEDEKFRVRGTVTRVTVIKSRLSYTGRQFLLVLTDQGFDNAWSNLRFMADEKVLKGAGIGYFLEHPTTGEATKRFSLGQFRDLYEDGGDLTFRNIADAALENALLDLIPQPGGQMESMLIEEGKTTEAAEAELRGEPVQ